MPVFGKKRKGIFIEQSEFSFLVARTSSWHPPFTIEALGELPLDSEATGAAFFGGLADFGSSPWLQAICGIQAPGRFVLLHEAESANKAKDPGYFEDILKDKYQIDSTTSDVDILRAQTGARHDFASGTDRRFICCGAPRASFVDLQSQLLAKGVYPSRIEMNTLATIGAVIHYAASAAINEPILFLELGMREASLFILQDGTLEEAVKIQRGIESIFPHLQKELSLKDESSARRLLFSNTFDFTDLGRGLIAEIIREVQALTGSYEVRTGQLVEHSFVSLLPRNLAWIGQTLASSLGLQPIRIDYLPWLKSLGIEVDDGVDLTNRGPRWLGLFGLMADYPEARVAKTTTQNDEAAE